MKLPASWAAWSARDVRAGLALVASFGGALALTGYAAAIAIILWRGGWAPSTADARIALLGKALLLSLTGSLVVLISMGFAINKRSVKISRDGLDMSGGDDEEDGVTVTASATVTPSKGTTDVQS